MNPLLLFSLLLSPLACAEDDYYKILEISRSASNTDIKSAFRRLSKKYHPDLNKEAGSSEKFAKVTEAYEILSNEEKRKKYDRFGKEGLKEMGMGHNDPFDIFSEMFGGRRNFHREQEKAPSFVVKLFVSLEDIYNGKEIRVEIFKKSTCFHCRGSGAENPDDVKNCEMCNGRGIYVQRIQVAPGFIQQMQSQCPKCGGKGKIVTSTCHVCRGKKLMDDMEKFTITIEKGVPQNHKIVMSNQGDDFVDKTSADVVFIVKQKKHAFFTRMSDQNEKNLKIVVPITLKEALLGFTKRVRHLDGHEVKITRTEVTQPGQIIEIEGEGMPQHNFPSETGKLIVEFKVGLPEKLNSEQKRALGEFFKM